MTNKLEILNLLLSLLESANFDKNLKLNIFSTVGDIFLAAKHNALPYLQKTIQIYN